MAFFILRIDEGTPSCVSPMTSGGAYLNMATQTSASKHRFESHHLGSHLDNRDFGKRFRGKVPKSDRYRNRMCKTRSLMRRGTFDTLLSEESDIPSEEIIRASEHLTDFTKHSVDYSFGEIP